MATFQYCQTKLSGDTNHLMVPKKGKLRLELQYRPLIRAQAFGEAVEPDRLERLARYEVHLDRKLERTVAMLPKLQELRGTSKPG